MKSRYIIILLYCIFQFLNASAQQSNGQPFALTMEDVLNDLTLPSHWKYHKGDDPQWSKADFDDSNWKILNARLWLDTLDETTFDKIGWFRLHLKVDSALFNKDMAFRFYQRGASEVYLNGRLVYRFGKVSDNPAEEKKYNPFGFPIAVQLDAKTEQVIAIRYSSTNAWPLFKTYGRFARTAGFYVTVSEINETLDGLVEELLESAFSSIFLFGVFLGLGFLHLIIFLFYPQLKPNLYYGLFSIFIGSTFVLEYLRKKTHEVDYTIGLNLISFFLTFTSLIFIIRLLYSIFYEKPPRQYYFFLLMLFICIISSLNQTISQISLAFYYVLIILETIRVIIVSVKKKKKWALTLGLGVIFFIFCLIINAVALNLFGLSIQINSWIRFIVNYVGLLSISISMSIFLARDFARTNTSLSRKILEIQELSAKSLKQEKEKQEILAKQNETLETQVKERTKEIEEQKDEIIEKNHELEQLVEEIKMQKENILEKSEELAIIYQQTTDSLHYAQYIQKAILGHQEKISELFADAFIFLRAKDIVSGDFYWFKRIEFGDCCYKIAIAGDCTGHGVPGAFMTVMGHDFLTDIIEDQKIVFPEQILYELDKKIANALGQNQGDSQQLNDGMDISILVFNSTASEVCFAGAKSPLIHIRDQQIHEIKASKFPIGINQYKFEKVFERITIPIQQGDKFYLFSDGFQDQFGGEEGKKYMKGKFRELLFQIHEHPMAEQKQMLKDEINKWQGGNIQTDDILVMGIQI